jgi:hypothetical protein
MVEDVCKIEVPFYNNIDSSKLKFNLITKWEKINDFPTQYDKILKSK